MKRKSRSHGKRKRNRHAHTVQSSGPTAAGHIAAAASGSQSKIEPSSKPKSMAEVAADIEAAITKDLGDLQIQVARLGLVKDFVRVFIEGAEKGANKRSAQTGPRTIGGFWLFRRLRI